MGLGTPVGRLRAERRAGCIAAGARLSAGACALEIGCGIRIVPFDWLHPALPPALIGAIGRLGRLLENTPLPREFSGSLYIRAIRPF